VTTEVLLALLALLLLALLALLLLALLLTVMHRRCPCLLSA
jgi:hypothetical protein